MTTIVRYGEITMYNVQTRRWDQEVVYDESGTDVIGARFSLAFEGIIHAQRVPLDESVTYVTTGVGQPSSAVAAYTSIRLRLNRCRERLTVLIDNEVMLDVTPSTRDPLGESTDLDNGPKPRRVEITSIASNQVFRVRFEIDAMVGQCTITNRNMVVSNRWSVAESMDSNFYTTRTIDGRLRLAVSREVFENFPAGHQFRGLVFPILETGFRRDSISFTAEEDGLKCRYTVVDRQVHHSAPWPATDILVHHTEGTSDGIKYGSSVQVQLKGPPHVDKRLLIERAIEIANSRLEFLNQSSTPTQIITKAEITDIIGPEAIITLSMSIWHQIEPRALLTHLRVNILGKPLRLGAVRTGGSQGGQPGLPGDEIPGTEYDHTVSPLPQTYGYSPTGERRPAILVMLHAYLADAECPPDTHRAIGFSRTTEEATEGPRVREPTELQEVPDGVIPETTDEDRYRPEAKEALYTISKITSEYFTHDMKVGMPISRSAIRHPDSPTCVVFDLCEPQAWRRVDIDVERIGELPKIPEPHAEIRDGSLIATRKYKSERIYPPVLTVDGRHEVFRVEATYWYILNRPPKDDENLRIASHHFAQGLTNFVSLTQLYDSQLA